MRGGKKAVKRVFKKGTKRVFKKGIKRAARKGIRSLTKSGWPGTSGSRLPSGTVVPLLSRRPPVRKPKTANNSLSLS